MVNRLVRKQALGYRKEGRIHLYYPKVEEGECVAEETDAFLDRVFDGSLKPLVSHIIGRKKLTRKQIDELKRLLDKGGKP